MPRRTATLLASTLTLVTLLCVALLVPVPYSEMSPGPTVNTLGEHGGEPVLRISGRRTYPTSGHLNMTTVRVTSADYTMNLIEVVTGWLAHDEKVVEHDTLYPEGQTAEDADQENAEEFTQSEDSAKAAALKELGVAVGSRVIVSAVVKDGPSEGRLHPGDVIKSVGGTRVRAAADVAKLVTRHKPGQKVIFIVVPQKSKTAEAVTVTTKQSDDGGRKRAIVGIEAGVEHTFPFSIDIKLADVGGPSAGLMFALGIVDKLTPGDLTGGKFVAGTGTIGDDGKVGPIGGIDMKIIGARSKGAQYFLTPADNCAEAASDTPSGVRLIKVRTIDDAMKALTDIREGNTAALPKCSAN